MKKNYRCLVKDCYSKDTFFDEKENAVICFKCGYIHFFFTKPLNKYNLKDN